MDVLQDLWSHPVGHAALLGLWAALAVDLRRWLSSTGWRVEGFVWATATKAWLTGAVAGALAALGLG